MTTEPSTLEMRSSRPLGHYSIEWGFAAEPKSRFVPQIRQVHGVTVSQFKGISDSVPEADAIQTRLCNTEIHVSTADCLPVLLAAEDPKTGEPVLAAIHSGWRGAAQGIVPKVLEQWPAPLSETRAMLGPCILPCHFEVRDDFIDVFLAADGRASDFVIRRDRQMFFDLSGYVRLVQLAPLAPENVSTEFNFCTFCHQPPLPSFRRNKGTDPQLRAWIRAVPGRATDD